MTSYGANYIKKQYVVVLVKNTILFYACILFSISFAFADMDGPETEDTSPNHLMTKHSIILIANKGGTCSGTIITPHLVITAAHCFHPDSEVPSPEAYIIGKNYPLEKRVFIKPYKMIIHDLYKPELSNGVVIGTSSNNDIALYYYKEPLIVEGEEPENFPLIGITGETFSMDSDLYIYGYGHTDFKIINGKEVLNGVGSLKIGSVPHKIIKRSSSGAEYHLYFETLRSYNFSDPSNPLINIEKKIDNTQVAILPGDSGGSLVKQSNSGHTIIIGITSAWNSQIISAYFNFINSFLFYNPSTIPGEIPEGWIDRSKPNSDFFKSGDDFILADTTNDNVEELDKIYRFSESDLSSIVRGYHERRQSYFAYLNLSSNKEFLKTHICEEEKAEIYQPNLCAD